MIKPSLPKEFVQRIQQQWPLEADAFLISLDQDPYTSIQVKQGCEVPFESVTSIPYSEYGYFLGQRPVFTLDPRFHLGEYYPQEASSMFIGTLVKRIQALNKVELALDLCAAPGGKSILLRQTLGKESVIHSNEINAKRFEILQENLIKWGDPSIRISKLPPEKLYNMAADLVLVDAPCSGEGMFRKDPNARVEWSQNSVLSCSKTQLRIIQEVPRFLKKGGFLIYSTCTFSHEENQGACEQIMASGLFENVFWDVEHAPYSVVRGKNYSAYQFLPHRTRGEGFFCAVFQFTGSGNAGGVVRPKGREFVPYRLPTLQEQVELKSWVTPDTHVVFNDKNECFAYFQDPDLLSWNSKEVILGIKIGDFVRNTFVPFQGLIAAKAANPNLPRFEVNTEKALLLLRSQDWTEAEPCSGWQVVSWQGRDLGWIKGVQYRRSNHYPKHWRIRNL